MKQMRSRFRLLTLLLVCAFLLTVVLCAGSVFREAGVTLSSLLPGPSSLPGVLSPAPSVSPDASPETSPDAETTPSPSDAVSSPDPVPGTDNSPNPEYNIFGL